MLLHSVLRWRKLFHQCENKTFASLGAQIWREKSTLWVPSGSINLSRPWVGRPEDSTSQYSGLQGSRFFFNRILRGRWWFPESFLMFPKVPQSSLGIFRVPQLPPPLEHPGTLKNPRIFGRWTKHHRLSCSKWSYHFFKSTCLLWCLVIN